MVIAALLTASAVVALVATERLRALGRSTRLVWVFKPLASTGFVATAVAAGAIHGPFGMIMLSALALSALGDVLLIPRDNEKTFIAGMGAFLAGHVCFISAFFYSGIALSGAIPAAAAMLVVGAAVLRWLWPHTQGLMRTMVAVYVVVFSLMVVMASGASARAGTVCFAAAGALFVASDIMTARQQFVRRQFINKWVGLPLYYAAQLLFAASAGASG